MNDKISYGKEKIIVNVLLGKRIIGTIKSDVFLEKGIEQGFQYFPKGCKDGDDIYRTLLSCKSSLEGK